MMTSTLPIEVHAADREMLEPAESVPEPLVLPQERPLPMPEQDLTISPMVATAYRWLRAPGYTLRMLTALIRRRRPGESHHVT